MRTTSLLLLFVLSSALAGADDLTTRDGKVYHGYKVLSHDAGYVTIMYSDGGGKIPLSELPDDLQQKYGYNKAQADAFVQASLQQDRQDHQAIVNEARQHEAQIAAQARAAEAPPPPVAVPSAVPRNSVASAVPAQNSPAVPPTAVSSRSSGEKMAPMSQEDIDGAEEQIGKLTADISFMADQEGMKDDGSYLPGHHPGAFADKITAEKAEIRRLEDRLIEDNQLVGLSIPLLTQDEIDAFYAKIAELRQDMSGLVYDSYSGLSQTSSSQQPQIDSTAIAALRGPAEEKVAQAQADIQRIEDRLKVSRSRDSHAPLPQDQLDMINAQLAALQTDIASLRREGGGKTRGAYGDKIIVDTAKVEELQAELDAHK